MNLTLNDEFYPKNTKYIDIFWQDTYILWLSKERIAINTELIYNVYNMCKTDYRTDKI